METWDWEILGTVEDLCIWVWEVGCAMCDVQRGAELWEREKTREKKDGKEERETGG